MEQLALAAIDVGRLEVADVGNAILSSEINMSMLRQGSL